MNRVTRRNSIVARNFANKLLKKLHKKIKNNYIFNENLVGSACWNTIIKDNKGFFDLDYQLVLTTNSKEYKDNGFDNPTKIKNDFFGCINSILNDYDTRVENSTTAITIINKNNKFSIDIVIIRTINNRNEIIRRNNQKGSSINEFTWNQLPDYNKAYKKIKSFTYKEKIDLIEKHVLPRKAKEKAKYENDPTKRSSCEVFIEEINNYVARKRNNRLQ